MQLEMWTPDLYIGAENELNIFCLAQNSGAATEEERARLESVAEFHLGDFVNKFCVGSLVMQVWYHIPLLIMAEK
jgi:DNA damage-binding protein 1